MSLGMRNVCLLLLLLNEGGWEKNAMICKMMIGYLVNILMAREGTLKFLTFFRNFFLFCEVKFF
jgi:hypothetical protein